MIVFNLSCSLHHHFDGWFRSADDFDTQLSKGLVECPLCGDREISKLLSAPRINVGALNARAESTEMRSPTGHVAAGEHEVVDAATVPGLQAHMLQQFKQFVLANTENVGPDFAETARKMHYGEIEQRNIRGRISHEESQALREEGIETVGLPPGIVLDDSLQ
ncbi:hypothetical protein AEM42_08655 [Betaproteobacteria bacterium UKL13-2]|jgi:hypothetical protein|nr:hypothetical protein AEM42_08655 [Betaproteobacteria bacterium UKL13-2]HCG53091.1 DUF1178 domain-containing protein [Betaproteobacteria bacterium]